MTRTIHYTDRFAPQDSSVIKEVFYDSERRELYVALHSGTIAGYSNVPGTKFNEFKNYSSPGQFWNWYVKGVYGTLNGDVNFAPLQKVQSGEGTQSFSVVVDIKGDLKFDIDAADVATAVAKVTELVQKSVVTGAFFVKEVKFNQQGN